MVVVLWPAETGRAGDAVEVLVRFDPFASVDNFPQLSAADIAAMGLANGMAPRLCTAVR